MYPILLAAGLGGYALGKGIEYVAGRLVADEKPKRKKNRKKVVAETAPANSPKNKRIVKRASTAAEAASKAAAVAPAVDAPPPPVKAETKAKLAPAPKMSFSDQLKAKVEAGEISPAPEA